MAVIERYIANRRPEPARGVDTRVDQSVGRALQGLGGAVGRAGANIGQQQLFDIQEENREQNFSALENERLFQQRARQARQEAINNMAPDGTGHEEAVNTALQQAGAEFGATLPDRLQEKYAERWARFTEGQSFLAGQEELTQSRQFAAGQADETANESLAGLVPTEQSYKEVIANFDEWISADPRLSPTQKEEFKQDFQRRVKLAYAQLDDPENVRRQAGQQTDSGDALDIIRNEEGFRPNAYWDVNAWRTGYGHDVVVREDGSVEKVTKDTKVTRQDAERTMEYLINNREGKQAREQVGDAWRGLPSNVQSALYSVAYNYGSLPSSVVNAAKSGDTEAIATAVGNLSANPQRRQREAALIRGGEVDSFNPYEDLDFETRMKLVNASESAIEERNKTFDLLSKQQVEQEYDRFRLGIETGDIRQDEEILQNEFFDDGQKATLLGNLRAAEKRRGDDQDTINAFNDGTLMIDPFSSEDRKSVNMLYETAVNGGADQQEAAEYITQRAGIAPPDAVNQIRAGLDSTNPQVYSEALQRAQRLSTASDYAFSGAPGAESIQKQVDAFEHYSRYLPADAAAQKMLQMQDPQFKRTADQILKSEEKEILNRTGETDVRKALDATGFFGIGDAAIGSTPMQRSAIVAEYRDIYENAIIDAQGDHELATEYAYKRFGQIYGVTDADGINRIMRLPPEKDPNTAPLTNLMNGDTGWISDQLVKDVSGYAGKDITREDIFLQADNITESDRLNNRPWSYQVFYFDETWQRTVDRFVVDPQRAAGELSETVEEQEADIVSDTLQERSERELEREAGRRAHQEMMDAHPLVQSKEVERSIIQQRIRNLTGQ